MDSVPELEQTRKQDWTTCTEKLLDHKFSIKIDIIKYYKKLSCIFWTIYWMVYYWFFFSFLASVAFSY